MGTIRAKVVFVPMVIAIVLMPLVRHTMIVAGVLPVMMVVIVLVRHGGASEGHRENGQCGCFQFHEDYLR